MQQTRKSFIDPFKSMPITEQVSETCYRRLVELAKVAYMAVSRANPLEARQANSKVEARYQEAHRQVKQHLNFYKKNLRDMTMFATITCHPGPYDYSTDQSTKDYRSIVTTQYRMLRTRLIDYADMLMPEADVPTFLTTLDKVFEREYALLMNGPPGEGLGHYEFAPRFTEETF